MDKLRKKYRHTLETGPEDTPVSLAEVKSHLRIDHDEDDTILALYLQAAVSRLDGYTGILGRALMSQTWRVTIGYDGRPSSSQLVYLPVAPVSALTSIKYYDDSNQLVTADNADFEFVNDTSDAWVRPANDDVWMTPYDRPDALQIDYVTGYGAAEDVPAPLKAAVLLMTGDLYEHRETVSDVRNSQIPMSMTVQNLIAPYRLVGG